MERNYKLYVHITPNGKKYYGITKQEPKKRWLNGKGYKGNKYFARTIEKYGWNNIEHIILQEELTECEARELEQYMIQWYDTANPNYGYNISLGGESNSGYVCTEEHKRKISEAKKGHPCAEETKQKIGKANKGKNSPQAKSIICITTNAVFYAVREAGRYYNMSSNSSWIPACCKGERKSVGKSPDGIPLVWKYIDIIEL
jgi:hypothetical protein